MALVQLTLMVVEYRVIIIQKEKLLIVNLEVKMEYGQMETLV